MHVGGPLYYNPEEPMPAQTADWTCSACSLAWLNRALAIDVATDEWAAVEYIGEPENINATWGLTDGSGTRLVECLREQGAPAFSSWPSWLATYQLATVMPLLIGGVAWNHWVGVRFGKNQRLHLANSALGWMGVTYDLSEAQWYDLGPFAVIPVPLLARFPPTPQS